MHAAPTHMLRRYGETEGGKPEAYKVITDKPVKQPDITYSEEKQHRVVYDWHRSGDSDGHLGWVFIILNISFYCTGWPTLTKLTRFPTGFIRGYH